jgi:hypothetical protein
MRQTHPLRRLAAVTALAAIPLALSAPTATAIDLRGTVSPTSAAVGATVSLRLTGCGSSTGTASSTAFGQVTLRTSSSAQGSTLFATAIVSRNATAGSHPVTFTCGGSGGETVTAAFTVTPGPARGGLGGSIEQLSTAEVVAGGTLVTAALGGGYWVLRRRAVQRV